MHHANSFVQVSYGIAGALILAGIDQPKTVFLIVFDAVSSLFGAFIFYRLSKVASPYTVPDMPAKTLPSVLLRGSN